MARPKGIPFSEENEGLGYAEFSVTRVPDRKIKMQRLLLVLLYAALAVAYCAIFLVVWKLGALIAILPLLLLILWLVTWKLTKMEYTYVVCRGLFHIYRVNGFNRAREVFCARISESVGIYPADDADRQADALDFSAGMGTSDLYIGIFSTEKGQAAVYFTAAGRLLCGLRYYGGERVVVTAVSH